MPSRINATATDAYDTPNRRTAAANVQKKLIQFKMLYYWLVVYRVLCAKVVGATSSEGFLDGYCHTKTRRSCRNV